MQPAKIEIYCFLSTKMPGSHICPNSANSSQESRLIDDKNEEPDRSRSYDYIKFLRYFLSCLLNTLVLLSTLFFF